MRDMPSSTEMVLVLTVVSIDGSQKANRHSSKNSSAPPICRNCMV